VSTVSEARLGVIVPFRDESLVLARKLADLARARWPAGVHRLVLVDDHSRDESAAIAREFARAEENRPFEVLVLESAGLPGKPAAIARAIAALGDAVDVIVLTDADVLLGEDALRELALAFRNEPALALASGTCATHAASAWDRCTERLRALESRVGILFNAHGQLLAWRAAHRLVPTPGLAADDLDLVMQVRARRLGRVRLVARAVYHEERPPDPRARQRQALRRTRAFLQAMRSRPLPPGALVERAQWLAYRWFPPLLPAGALALAFLALAFAIHRGGARGGLLGLLLGAAACASSPGRALLARLATIARADFAERAQPLPDHWGRDRS
jgi:cellulose synthase/poly-beta-1,6-N-acetylglucosamine synthase-like glycosyltransferase